MNHAIRASQVRVIGSDGAQLGVLALSEALRLAQLEGLDLVEISPNATPPVARIVDWGKFNYQKTKQLQKQKKQQKIVDIKQMRVGMRIGDHDINIKVQKTRKFLEAGHKVKLMLLYRGRENAHKELGFALFDRFTEALSDIAVIDQPAQINGRNLTVTYRRNPAAKLPKPESDANETSPPKAMVKNTNDESKA